MINQFNSKGVVSTVLNILGDYKLVYAHTKMSIRFPSPVGHFFMLFVRICLYA